MLKLYDIRCDFRENPNFLNNTNPGFFWKLKSDNKGVFQKAYRLIIDGVYDSGRVESDASVQVECEGLLLRAETEYTFSVEVWDNKGENAKGAGRFTTGLMSADGFVAKFIESDEEVAVFQKKFEIHKKIKKAFLYATAYGVYDAYLNGKRVGDDYLAPGFISYNKRLEFQSYDITDMVKKENAIGVTVGEGWCRSRLRWNGDENRTKPYFGRKCALAAQIVLYYEDGEREVIVTDGTWRELPSEVIYSDIYNGEICDGRRKIKYDDYSVNTNEYPFAKVSDYTTDHIVCGMGLPVRETEIIKPKEIIKTPKGETVIDFGVNMTGWAEFTVEGNAGDRVIYDHGEVLDRDGNFYTENLRFAKQEVIYTLGDGITTFHPRFTFMGFRYVRVKEFPGEVTLNNFIGRVIHSDMRRIGHFECSNEKVNKLYENIVRTQRSVSVDLPTDNSQRDERGGWTGDTQLFSRTAVRNFESPLFYEKWLATMAADQYEDGMIPDTVPEFNANHTACGYGDACTIIPWEIYLNSGDKQLLKRQYPVMKKWIEYIKAQGENELLWNTGEHYGDWLAMDDRALFSDQAEGYEDQSINKYSGATDHGYLATGYFSHSALITSKVAGVLGYEEEAKQYKKLHNDIREEFRKVYLDGNEDPKIKTQTAYALGLKFGLFDDPELAAAKLNKMIVNNDSKICAGILGYGDVCPELTKYGYKETAYSLLLQTKCPSWLYAVEKGATTIWEHWDGIKEDGTFCDPDMNSFNQPTLGNIGFWMYSFMAGIKPIKAAYKEFEIAPETDERIDYVSASIDTPYGKIVSSWKKEKTKTVYEIEVPENTEGEFVFPDGGRKKIFSGKYQFEF